jgi:hypothetical protein
LLVVAILLLGSAGRVSADSVPAHLPGELSAADVLNGVYPYPPSPKSPVGGRAEGFDASKLGKVPPPGVHPRILKSPDERADIECRLKNTDMGRTLYSTLQKRLTAALHDPKNWTGDFYNALSTGNLRQTQALIKECLDSNIDVVGISNWVRTDQLMNEMFGCLKIYK